MSSRAIYPLLLTSALVAGGLIVLRPKLALELLDIAREARAQAPDDPAFGRANLPDSQNFLPQPPTQPMPVRYPQAVGSGPQQPVNMVTPQSPGAPAAHRMDAAMIIARVGPDVILASDMVGRFKQLQSAIEAGVPKAQLDDFRKELAAELKNMTDSKLLFLEATKTIPADPLKDIKAKILEQFDTANVKDMMERAKVSSKAELDAKLRTVGTSLDRRREAFFEMSVARMWLSQSVKTKPVEFPQIFAYYQDNLTKFDHPAEARWEQITVDSGKFTSKAEAYDAICHMGNDILQGKPFAEVAKAASQGPTANKGGVRDWTTQGSLKSTTLDGAIFSLPIGRMSQVIEDEDNFHVIRVLERKDAGRTSFSDAQSEIRTTLKNDLSKKENEEYLSKLRQKTPVWTVFDDLDQQKGPVIATDPLAPLGLRR